MPLRVSLQALGAFSPMRTCTDATKRQIVSMSAWPTSQAWLRAALSDCFHDKPMSLQRERRMCAALGIEAPPNEYAVPACPDCGSVHHARCNGNASGTAVVLRDGQRVVTKRKPRQYSRIADMPTPMLARAIRERQAMPGIEGKVQ